VQVHQLLPTITPRDAVSNHTFYLRETLRSMGYESDIFALHPHPELASDTQPADQLPPDAHAVIYQFSIGSPAAMQWEQHRGRRLIYYHNITPVELVGQWDPVLASEIELGRQQLSDCAVRCDHAICASEFNRAELVNLGYPSTESIPVMFDVSRADPDPTVVRSIQRRRDGLQILFVGRVIANKAQHDLVVATKVLRDSFGEQAHLHIVGTDGSAGYRHLVDQVVRDADMSQHVTFHGQASQSALVALYRATDVFLCLSDHEGFCVPIIEAMHHGLPVVAYNSAAVGDTVGDGGLLLENKDPMIVGAALSRVAQDPLLRQRLGDAARRRAEAFSLDRTIDRFKRSLEHVLGPV